MVPWQKKICEDHPSLVAGAKAYYASRNRRPVVTPANQGPVPPSRATAEERRKAKNWQFNFGVHKAETITEVMLGHSGYIDWCLSEEFEDLIESRPDYADALRALSSEYLEEQWELREAMAHRGIFPFDSEPMVEPVVK